MIFVRGDARRSAVVTASDLTEPGCELCHADELLRIDTVAVVAPAFPVSELDVWVGPRAHVASLIEVDRPTRLFWLEALRSLIGRWRSNCGSDGVNVFAYVGSPRNDWPAHIALRVIGRRAVEPANPVHAFNRRDVHPPSPDAQRAALLDAVGVVEPQRWHLSAADQLQTCMSCSPERLDDYFIADVGKARLFQHGGATDSGMLITCPIRHAERMEDLDEADFDSLLTTVEVVRSMFSTTLGASGLWLGFNDGPVAGQETPHVHIHLWARGPAEATNPFEQGLPPMVGRPTAEQVRTLRDHAREAFAAVHPAGK